MPQPQFEHAKLGFLALIAVGVLALRFAWAGIDEAVWFQWKLGYGFMWAMVALWLVFFVRAAHFERWGARVFAREHRYAWCLIAIATVFLHLFEPHVMRVLFDEPSQAVGALTMQAHRTAMLADHSNWIGGKFVLSGENASFRPYLFSFLVSLLHDLTGPRPANVFALNFLLTPAVLLNGYFFARRVAGPLAGYATIGLLATLPLLAHVATSGGYDLLNVALLGAFALFTLAYLEAPAADAARRGRLADLGLATALLMSMTRSESVLYIIPWGLVTLYRWWRERQICITPFAAISPIFLLPNLMVHLVLVVSEAQLHKGLRTNGGAYFSMGNLPAHLADLADYLFRFHFNSTNSLLLSATGGVGFVLLLVTTVGAMRLRALKQAYAWFAAVAVFVTGTYCLILTQFWSSPLDAIGTRFCLPMLFVWAILGGWWLSQIDWLHKRPAVIGGALVLWGAIYSAPAAARATQTHRLTQSRAEVYMMDFVQREGPEGTLCVARNNYGLMANRFASSDLDQLGQTPDRFVRAVKAGLYREVAVFQLFEAEAQTGTWRPATGNSLAGYLVLETIEERVLSPGAKLRISRMLGYRNKAGVLVTPSSSDAEVGLHTVFETAAERSAYLASLYP